VAEFAHLHVHSEYSLLDGVGRIDEIIAQAKAHGQSSLALTDHGVMYGSVDFFSAASSAGLKPIVGCEVYVAQNKRTDKRPKIDASPQHLVLLAQDWSGYKNLVQLVTKAQTEGFYYKPRVDKELLELHRDGIICLSACASGEVPRLIRDGDLAGARAMAAWYRDVYGKDNYYIELQRHEGLDWLEGINVELVKIANELGLRIVATNDVHYVKASDARAQDLLLCIQTNTNFDDPKRMRMTGQSYYLKSSDDMGRLFADYPEALKTSLQIAEQCQLKLDFGSIHLPQFDVPDGYTPETYLEKLCRDGLKRRYSRLTADVDERLRYELDVIKKTGFALYILIVWDIVSFARKQGIMYGPRGSAAGALVLYLLGISDVDPVANNLTFERFLNIERKEMPDVDMDFADDRRDEVIDYVAQKYGRDHVAQIITFGTLGAKAAIRDVGRARGLPYGDVDRVAKLIPSLPIGMTIEQSIEENSELRRMVADDDAVRTLIEDAKSVEGISRHASTHAAGVVISRDPLADVVPLQPTSRGDGGVMSQYGQGALARIGLLKMDFLGLTNLTILGQTLELIRQTRGIQIDLLRLPVEDKKSFEMLGRGETVGVFQVEGRGMTQYLKELRPTNIGDLAAMIALYRPGPMTNIPKYIARKHGDEPVEYPHPLLEETLKDTFGVLTYQDQVLQVLSRVAGYSLGQADIVRKAMGKKVRALMEAEQPKFLKGARARGLTDAEGLRIWELLEPFAGYGFNRAHASCYAMVAYQTAYLKANYPAEYMVAVLLAASGTTERVVTAVTEARRLKIPLLGPDVNRSKTGFAIDVRDSEPAIRWGLAAIKNVGEAAVAPIVEARDRQGPFTSLDDFCNRVDLRGINKRVLESLVKAGAFDSLGRRGQILAVIDRLVGVAQKNQQASDAGQTSLFDVLPVEPTSVSVALPDVPEVPTKERLGWEKELLGIYLSEHPLQSAAVQLLDLVTAQASELTEDFVGRKITVGGMLTSVRNLTTKKKDTMVSAVLEDLTGSIDLVAFPKTYEKTRDQWVVDNLVLITGKLDVREERFQIAVDTIEPLDTAEASPGDDTAERQPAQARSSGPMAPVVNISDYQSTRRVSETAADGRSLAPSYAAVAAPNGGGSRRKLILQLRRTGDEQADIEQLNRVGALVNEYAGGNDLVELMLIGGSKPRIELEWPSLKIRWDRQLHRTLAGVLGSGSVQLDNLEEIEKAVAP
jgi:DNA polymerase-3 subunit alpha